jgi:ribosomal protein L12E/L44/L45/RPP1/RPP2
LEQVVYDEEEEEEEEEKSGNPLSGLFGLFGKK